jgi:CheY-like chemotaxis protein
MRLNGVNVPIELYSCPIRFRGNAARLFTVRDLSPLALVVDDDRAVAKMTGALIRRLGYQTVTYANPLALLSDYLPHIVSLLISDIDMPELDGIAMVGRLREADPELPVLYVSGSVETTTNSDERTFVLAKPFGLQGLQEVLAGFPERARADLK